MAAQVAGLPSLIVRPTRGNSNLVNRATDSKPAPWIAAALVEADNSRAAVTAAVEENVWGIEKSPAVRAEEIPARSAAPPKVGVQRVLAVRAGAPAWAAGEVGAAAVADDGGKEVMDPRKLK